jgi:hypothetical protein
MPAKLPYMPFYFDRWWRDMRRHPHDIRSMWLDIIGHAWDNGAGTVVMTPLELSQEWGVSTRRAMEVVDYLKVHQVAEVSKGEQTVSIGCRRLVKLAKRKRSNAKATASWKRKSEKKAIGEQSVSGHMLDVRCKMLDTDTTKSRSSADDRFPVKSEFERVWKAYPKRVGKKAAERSFRASVKTAEDVASIEQAMETYLSAETVRKGFVQNGSTWFNNWRDWIDQPVDKVSSPASKTFLCAICHKDVPAMNASSVKGVCVLCDMDSSNREKVDAIRGEVSATPADAGKGT